MSGKSFRSVFMVASCAGAALSCYLVSLRVASERAALEEVETEIVLAQRDIRLLQTEIGTRGRLAQLERWNVKVLALSAPTADQFVNGGFELARMVAPQRKPVIEAPVVLASAPTARVAPSPVAQAPRPDTSQPAAALPVDLMHQASLKPIDRTAPAKPPRPVITEKPAPTKTKATPTERKAAEDGASASAKPQAKKSVDNKAVAAPKSVTKPARLAKTDPLAPVTGASKRSKDSGSAR
jgi:cytoskeletal protein RodZ